MQVHSLDGSTSTGQYQSALRVQAFVKKVSYANLYRFAPKVPLNVGL